MKTLFQTFGGEILKIWKPWKNAREAREKNWAFLRVLQGKTTKNGYFLRFQIGKKWTFGRPGFWKYQNPDSNIWPDFENMKTLFQKFGRKITKGGGLILWVWYNFGTSPGERVLRIFKLPESIRNRFRMILLDQEMNFKKIFIEK